MAKISPFCAVRPTLDKVSLVTSRSYDEYSVAELASQLDFNPFSFLHILNPIYVNQHKVSLEKRFKLVAQKYKEFKADDIFLKEETPAFYLYEIQTKDRTFTGIVAGTSIEDYQTNIIKKHEDTIQYRVALFKDYLHETQFNTEPVLLTYPDDLALNNWINFKKQIAPIYTFSTKKREKHLVWKIDSNTDIEFIKQRFEEIGSLYIADGHHRTASAEMLYEQDKAGKNPNISYFMSFVIAESNLKIFEFNRVIRDLNNHSLPSLLLQLSDIFIVESKGHELWKPTQKFEFGMYVDSCFYALTLKDVHNLDSPLASLDAQILFEKVLKPILGIQDLRNDERIEYIPGNQSLFAIKELIDEGEFKIGFILYPTSISEVKLLADNNLIMPPKTTYIEPKCRSGLFVYEL